MKTKITWVDRIMAAVTFAEANEHEAGKEFLPLTGRKSQREEKCTECDGVLTAELHGAEVHS